MACAAEVEAAVAECQAKFGRIDCKYVLPVMEKQATGAIVNLSSIAGLRMSHERAHIAYSTAKFGILAFSKFTATAFAKKGIRCNTVIPGLMKHAAGGASPGQDCCRRRSSRPSLPSATPPFLWVTWGRPGTSHVPSFFWRRTRLATSRAPRSSSTAV
jgi:NAD(P)-dependent dehydrogenase (short-subunit alcohol dehydrogenase family)